MIVVRSLSSEADPSIPIPSEQASSKDLASWGCSTSWDPGTLRGEALYLIPLMDQLTRRASALNADFAPLSLIRELGKRTAIFACCAYAGSMFSGFMQVGIQEHMNGRYGLAGWRWLFSRLPPSLAADLR
jgi:hypothetical protein